MTENCQRLEMNFVPGSSGAVPATAPENENIKLLLINLVQL